MQTPELKRTIRDSVFAYLFRQPENTRELYPALHPEDIDVRFMRFIKGGHQSESKQSASAQGKDNGKWVRKPGGPGGKIVMSDDFAAPLESFREYMQ